MNHLQAGLLVSMMALCPVAAAEPPTDQEIQEAVKRAQDWLIAHQLKDGTFEGLPHVGQTALCIHALLQSGLPVDHPAIRAGAVHVIGYARQRPLRDPMSTYNTSLVLLALDSLRGAGAKDPSAPSPGGRGTTPGSSGTTAKPAAPTNPFADEMAACAHLLLQGQIRAGGWSYMSPNPAGINTGAIMDLSNTQYAALGLWAARRNGIEIPPEAWQRLCNRLLAAQNADGSWNYMMRTGSNTTNWQSTIVGGIGTLAICAQGLRGGQAEQAASGSPGRKTSGPSKQSTHVACNDGPAINRAFTVLAKIGMAQKNGYYLYGLERACALTGKSEIDGEPWYPQIASLLVKSQNPDGSWWDARGERNNPKNVTFVQSGSSCETSWCLLTLVLATKRTIQKYPDSPGQPKPSNSSSR